MFIPNEREVKAGMGNCLFCCKMLVDTSMYAWREVESLLRKAEWYCTVMKGKLSVRCLLEWWVEAC